MELERSVEVLFSHQAKFAMQMEELVNSHSKLYTIIERAVKMVEGLLSIQEGFSNALLTLVESQRKNDTYLERLIEIQRMTEERVSTLITNIDKLCQQLGSSPAS